MNLITVDGHKATIAYDPELDMFRGEIWGLNGGADFYGRSLDELREEFRNSLSVFLEVCQEKGISPFKTYSGQINISVAPELHGIMETKAIAAGKPLNQWIADTLKEMIYAYPSGGLPV